MKMRRYGAIRRKSKNEEEGTCEHTPHSLCLSAYWPCAFRHYFWPAEERDRRRELPQLRGDPAKTSHISKMVLSIQRTLGGSAAVRRARKSIKRIWFDPHRRWHTHDNIIYLGGT